MTTYEYARVAPRGEVAIRRLLTLAAREPEHESTEVFGWSVPQPFALASLVVQVLALIMLILVQETWRATRAADG